MAKTVYRLGLGHRYGRLMQTISGVHYNFSMPEAIWPYLADADESKDEKNDSFERLDSNSSNESNLWNWSYNNIASIYQDLDDKLWFGVGRNIYILVS